MIPKGGGTDFRGIGLVDVLWKAISGIINRQLSSSIQFHDVIHGFCTGRGTGTTTLKEKLLQQLVAMREMVLHTIFLGLRTAYGALDRERYLDTLARYGVGPRTICILQMYWAQLQMAAKVGGGLRARLPEPLWGNSGGPSVTYDL